MSTEIRLLRGTSVRWASTPYILDAGEQGFETDTGKFKLGDGFSRWADLSYFLPEDLMLVAIDEAVANSEPGGGSLTLQDLVDHVNAPLPHPVYDDGPSLSLLYENAKV